MATETENFRQISARASVPIFDKFLDEWCLRRESPGDQSHSSPLRPTYHGDVLLRERDRQPEKMDDPDLPAAIHDHALDGLARLNAWSRSDVPFRQPLRDLLATASAGATILDLATGSGDLIVKLDSWLSRHGHPVRWAAVDISGHALERTAERGHAAGIEIRTHRLDVLSETLPACDVAVCSLFLHHLDSDSIVRVLERLGSTARLGGVVCDLRRSTLGLLLASTTARLATRSPVVHYDAPASVRASLTSDELLELARRAGLPEPRVDLVFPQRQRLTWRRKAIPT